MSTKVNTMTTKTNTAPAVNAKTATLLNTLTADQRRAFDWLKQGVPAAQKKADDKRIKQALAEISRLEKWALPVRR